MNFLTTQENQSLETFFADNHDVDYEPTDLRNDVARIALSVIQKRLPQVAMFSGDGTVTLGRQKFDAPARTVMPLPQYLFMINWADSAPGISWPEAYHVTFVPGFDRYVVTASQDSSDMWGVTELAIGYFGAGVAQLDGCRSVITDWWRMQGSSADQPRWAYVWEEGTVSAAEAGDWAEDVWPEDNNDEEEEED